MSNLSPSANPPISAALVASVITGLLAAFTELSVEQVAAIGAAVNLVAAFVAQRWTVPKGAEG